MVYAQVVVNHKTVRSQVFTYRMTAQQLLHIQVGQLVEVPFRNSTTAAIVVRLTKTSKIDTEKLKNIKRMFPKPIITFEQSQLAMWLAKYYGVSLGEAFFAILPEFGRKQLITNE